MNSCIEGSFASFSSTHSSWSKGKNLQKYFITVHLFGKADRRMLSRRNLCLSVGAPHVGGQKLKLLRITCFQGNAQKDGSSGKPNGSNGPKNSIKVRDGDNVSAENSEAKSILSSNTSAANEGGVASPAIERLFRKWLTLLQTQPASPEEEGIFGGQPSCEMLEIQHESSREERDRILKVFWKQFRGQYAMIYVPLMIFAPLFLAVNIFCGTEVSKELTPLWVIGPFIMALYVKIFNLLSVSCTYSFNQATKLLKNSHVVYSYMIQGKVKQEFHNRVRQSLIYFRNLDYKDLSRSKLKELEGWLVEKYLDFLESIWPFCCHAVKIVKRSNRFYK